MWGVLAIFLKYALKKNDPLTIVWARFFLAFILLTIYLLWTDPTALKIKSLISAGPLFAVAGLLLNYWTYLIGVQLTSPSNAQIVIQLGPMLLALYGVAYFKEKLSGIQLFGLLLFLVGFGLFFWDQNGKSVSAHMENYKTGVLWIVLAAVLWSIYAFVQKKMLSSSHPQSLNWFINGFSALVFLPFCNFGAFQQYNGTDWAVLIFLGINTFVAYGSMPEALKRLPANQVSVIITCNPLITIILMQLLKHAGLDWLPHEDLGALSILGAASIVVGAILVVSKGRFFPNLPKRNAKNALGHF